MDMLTEQGKLQQGLAAPVAAIIDKHRDAIAPMLGQSGNLTRAALQNDAAVRTVAGYCYVLLPGLLKLAIKEPMFIDFVMTHRETVLARLVSQPA
jgi:hypothetical protein